MSAICHICSKRALEIFPVGSNRTRITSDCKPWSLRSDLAICHSCHTVQTAVTTEWREQVSKIYQAYQVYHQGGGAEQAVFTDSGEPLSRSAQLVKKLASSLSLSESGTLLDIGCGNGSLLAAFGRINPGWDLAGAEFDNKHASDLAAIERFTKLHTGRIQKIEDRFELISLIHTLEHIENPLPFLICVRKLLAKGGLVFIQVPNYRENPFELMTYDHASHFDVSTLTKLLGQAGLFPSRIATDWVTKEISIVASPVETEYVDEKNEGWGAQLCLEWLEKLITAARDIQATSESFGIFGSSIAATWTASNLPRMPDFFVDEDPARIGKSHLGLKILHPDSALDGSTVFVALQPNTQKRILEKYSLKTRCSWIGT